MAEKKTKLKKNSKAAGKIVSKNARKTKDKTKKSIAQSASKKEIKKNTPSKSKKTSIKTKSITKTKKDISGKEKKIKHDKLKNNEQIKKVLQKSDLAEQKALERGDVPMSVVGHLDELRSKLIVSLLTIIIITLGSFFLSEYIVDIINRPFLKTGLKLNVFDLTEGFIIRLKASLIAGIIIGLPIIVYELWRYISPAIEKNDRKFIGISISAAVLLLYAGISFTYFFILPIAIKMLISFTPVDMASTIGASKYLSFVLLFSLAMGFMFELPIIIMILTRMGILTPEILISKRKYAMVLFWIIAAMLTPPDVLTQSMLAIPVMLLYEISIIISKLIIKRKLKKQEAED